MSTTNTTGLTTGKAALSLVAAATAIGCYLADWNETHVKNPNWPPHARFHNGQTMSMGLGLGLATAYYTWRTVPSASVAVARDNVFTAAVFGSLYYITGMSAILYPGTKWIDPEFGEGSPQVPLFGGLFVLSWVGYFLEMRRLGAFKKA